MIDGVELSPVALANFDKLANGDLGDAIQRELEVAATDLEAFGKDGLPRKVVIEMALKLRRDGRVEIAARVFHKLPDRPVRKTVAVVTKTAKDVRLLFNPASAANPGQLTIEALAGEAE